MIIKETPFFTCLNLRSRKYQKIDNEYKILYITELERWLARLRHLYDVLSVARLILCKSLVSQQNLCINKTKGLLQVRQELSQHLLFGVR